MLFNSYTFVIFIVSVVAISRLISSWKARKVFLLFVSYLFYAAWNPPFILLLLLSTIVDWFAAKFIFNSEKRYIRKFCLLISIFVNLGMLSYFKYGNFLLNAFTDLLGVFGLSYDPPGLSIVLPVGISFYTFQTLSYTFDVYKGKSKVWHSFLDYALYVTFFPQLVAGPIVRAKDFLPQCIDDKRASAKQLNWGVVLIIVGLFNKMAMADGFFAPVCEQQFAKGGELGLINSWAGVLAFSGQIFCDFAGYSTCAIGSAMCLGFVLPDNFHFPYAAIGFSDFWKRWHISLSSWLRDYLYIPLGGNHKRLYFNLMFTMLLGGLWHGASWMFVIWGGVHGGLLILERILKKCTLGKLALWSTYWGKLFLACITYICICFTWLLFRAPDMGFVFSYLRSMLYFNGIGNIDGSSILALGLCGVMFILHWCLRDSSIEDLFGRLKWWCQGILLFVMVMMILASLGGNDNAFIYFQF